MSNKLKITDITSWFLFCSIFTGLLAFVPMWVTTALRVMFIVSALIDLSINGFVIRLNAPEKMIGVTLILFFIQTLFSQYMSVDMFLAASQLVVVNLLVLQQDDGLIQKAVISFLSLMEKIVLCAILYSLMLLIFGKTAWINGMWINYWKIISIRQIGYGMQGHLGYSSFFTNPNPFAFFVAVVLVWKTVNYKKTYAWWGVFIMCMCGLRIADSRAGYICAAIGLITVLYLKAKSKRNKQLIVVSATVVIGVFLLLRWKYIMTMLVNIDLAGRANKWGMLFDAFLKSPIIGNGYSSATKEILKGISTGTFSSYLTILAEEGTIGAILFFTVYVGLVFELIRKHTRLPSDKLVVLVITYSFQMGALGVVEDVFFNVTSRFLIWETMLKAALNNKTTED